MMKKSFAAAVVVAVFALGGAASAHATEYTPDVDCTASPAAPVLGQKTTIECDFGDLEDGTEVVFSTSGSGATLSSLVFAASSGSSITKVVKGGIARGSLSATTAGTYTVDVTAGETVAESATVTYVAAEGAAGADPDLIAGTGGNFPTVALWLGAGALGLGGLAIVAATARRRAQRR